MKWNCLWQNRQNQDHTAILYRASAGPEHGSQLIKTCFSLWEILHRENPVFITGMGLRCLRLKDSILDLIKTEHAFHSELCQTKCVDCRDITWAVFSEASSFTMNEAKNAFVSLKWHWLWSFRTNLNQPKFRISHLICTWFFILSS